MNFEPVTLKDIAKALGLSVSTVSKALKDSHEISDETKKKIFSYAKEHNYRPNPNALGLKKGKSKSIGIIVSTIDNHFFSQVINGMESVAYSKGYNVIIAQTHESFELEVQNAQHLTVRGVDGLLISLATETQNVDYLKAVQEKGLPIVFFDQVTREIDTHKIISDNFTGAYEATVHLLNSGYRRIAHITSLSNTFITSERLDGYKKALKDNGIEVKEEYIKFCAHGGKDRAEIEAALADLLKLDAAPDAILAAFDRITTTTLSVLHQLKVKIPGDVALVGFTNTALADVLNPSLTTVRQSAFEMGKKATEMLIGLIESKREITDFETILLPAELHVGDSSAPRK
jgi:LacI family transcriptional regulator